MNAKTPSKSVQRRKALVDPTQLVSDLETAQAECKRLTRFNDNQAELISVLESEIAWLNSRGWFARLLNRQFNSQAQL